MRAGALALFIIAGCWTAAVLGAQSPAALTGNSEYEGRPVASIVFVPARQPLEKNVLAALVPFKPGAAFRTADARSAIQKLYATGRYEDIAIDAEPQGQGVVVRITTKNSWFIGRVEIDGDVAEPPNAGQLVTASRLNLGEPFDRASLNGAAENMRRLLVSNGF